MFGFKRKYKKVAVGFLSMKPLRGYTFNDIPVSFTFEESTDKAKKRRIVVADAVSHWQDEVEAYMPVYHWLQGGPLPREAKIVPFV